MHKGKLILFHHILTFLQSSLSQTITITHSISRSCKNFSDNRLYYSLFMMTSSNVISIIYFIINQVGCQDGHQNDPWDNIWQLEHENPFTRQLGDYKNATKQNISMEYIATRLEDFCDLTDPPLLSPLYSMEC